MSATPRPDAPGGSRQPGVAVSTGGGAKHCLATAAFSTAAPLSTLQGRQGWRRRTLVYSRFSKRARRPPASAFTRSIAAPERPGRRRRPRSGVTPALPPSGGVLPEHTETRRPPCAHDGGCLAEQEAHQSRWAPRQRPAWWCVNVANLRALRAPPSAARGPTRCGRPARRPGQALPQKRPLTEGGARRGWPTVASSTGPLICVHTPARSPTQGST